jgi:hypothetical protein
MKRILCFLLIAVLLLACGGQAFADYDVLYCRMCGRQIPTDSKVCPYCGVTVVHVGDGSTAAAKSGTTTAAVPAQTVQNTTQTVPGPFNTTLDYSTGALINNGKVRVTKSPTSESVPYGGSCIFIAHAANAGSVTWYIANEDGTSIATAYEAADNVSGLYVSGGNTDTLKLSGIPSWMNGYQVQACFTGEGGPVYTNVAKIWTYQETVCQEEQPFWWWPDYIASLHNPPPPPPPPQPDPPPPPPPNGNTGTAAETGTPSAQPGGAPPAQPGGGTQPPPPPSM